MIFRGKKMILIVVIALMSGCTSNQTKPMVEAQNNEIKMLQEYKMEIIKREARTPKEMLRKKADLKMVDDQIKSAIAVQQNSQSIENQKNKNTISNIITGVGAVGAAAWGIHELTN